MILVKAKYSYGFFEATMKIADVKGMNNAFWMTTEDHLDRGRRRSGGDITAEAASRRRYVDPRQRHARFIRAAGGSHRRVSGHCESDRARERQATVGEVRAECAVTGASDEGLHGSALGGRECCSEEFLECVYSFCAAWVQRAINSTEPMWLPLLLRPCAPGVKTN